MWTVEHWCWCNAQILYIIQVDLTSHILYYTVYDKSVLSVLYTDCCQQNQHELPIIIKPKNPTLILHLSLWCPLVKDNINMLFADSNVFFCVMDHYRWTWSRHLDHYHRAFITSIIDLPSPWPLAQWARPSALISAKHSKWLV